MDFISDDKPVVDAIYYDDLNGENEVRLGTRRTPQPGRCAYFDGTNYIQVEATKRLDSAKYSANSSWSHTVVFKSQTINTSQTQRQAIYNATTAHLIELIYTYSNGTTRVDWLRFIFYTSGGTVTYYLPFTTKNVADMNFHTITWSYNGTGLDSGHKCYIDGIEYTLLKESGTFSGTVANGDIVIAKASQGAASVKGYLQCVLTTASFTSLNQHIDFANKRLLPENTEVYYKLDEGAGTTAYDSSGNGRHGTWTGLVASSHYTGSDVPYSYQNEVGYGNKIQANGGNVVKPTYPIGRTLAKNILTGDTSTNQFIHIPWGVGLRIYVEAPVSFNISHGAYGSGVVSLGTTGVWYTFTSYTTGNYALIDLRNAGASADWNNIYITVELLTLVPRNEANPTKDVLGNDLQFRGKVPVNLALKGSHCGYFNGTHKVTFGALPYSTETGTASDYIFRCRLRPDDATTNMLPIDIASNYIHFANSTNCIINGWGINATYTFPRSLFSLTQSNLVEITKLNGVFTLKVNDVVIYTLSKGISTFIDSPRAQSPDFNIGYVFNLPTSNMWKGDIYDVYFAQPNKEYYFHIPISEQGGTTIHNIAGTTHGTLTGDVTVFWSKTQGVFHHNLTKGFNLVGGVKIPAKNATQDALNNTLSNPAVKGYNMAETAIDFSGGVASPLALRVPTNWKGEADTSFIHSRRTSTKIDRILVNSTAPTGQQLLRQQRYTGKI